MGRAHLLLQLRHKVQNRSLPHCSSLLGPLLPVFVSALQSPFRVRQAEKLDPGFKPQLSFFQAVGPAASGFTSLTSVSFIAGLLGE